MVAIGALVLPMCTASIARAADLQIVAAFNASDVPVGTINVALRSSAEITSVRAEVLGEESRTPLAVVDNFSYHGPGNFSVIWSTDTPVILPDLGDYRVNIEATDAAGNHARLNNAGTLKYHVETFIDSFAATPASIDYYNRDVVVHGVLKGRWPGTQEVRPLPGFPVDIDTGRTIGQTVLTGSDGTFSKAVTPPVTLLSSTASYFSDRRFYDHSPQADVRIKATQMATRVTATVPDRATEGDRITLSGTVEREMANGWEPYASATGLVDVHLCLDGECDFGFGPLDTDAQGRFTANTFARHSGTYEIRVTPNFREPFFAESQGSSNLITVDPASASS